MIFDSLAEALERGVKVRILVLDPNSDIVKFRSIECGASFEPKLFSEGLGNYVNQIFSVASCGSKEQNLEMRLYSDLPNMPMYLTKNKTIDSKLFFSFYLNILSFKYPHFEVNGKSGFFSDFYDYFQTKWDRCADNILDKTSFE